MLHNLATGDRDRKSGDRRQKTDESEIRSTKFETITNEQNSKYEKLAPRQKASRRPRPTSSRRRVETGGLRAEGSRPPRGEAAGQKRTDCPDSFDPAQDK